MTVQTPFAKKMTSPKEADDRLFAPLRNYGEFDLALLDVINRVASVTL